MPQLNTMDRMIVKGLPDEENLVENARGDPLAFAELYRHYAVRIYHYLFAHVGIKEDAEDLTTQVFMAVWNGLRRYSEQGSFAAWIFRIARNKVTDWHRRRKPLNSLDSLEGLAASSGDPFAALLLQEDLHRLRELVASLPPDQKEILRLRYAAGLTYVEMGQVLGKREDAVRMAAARLLERLRQAWEQNDG